MFFSRKATLWQIALFKSIIYVFVVKPAAVYGQNNRTEQNRIYLLVQPGIQNTQHGELTNSQ